VHGCIYGLQTETLMALLQQLHMMDTKSYSHNLPLRKLANKQ